MMTSGETPPPLEIPLSATTVKVSAIDSTLWIVGAEASALWDPPIEGFDRVRCGTWSFLIEHPSGRKLLYDLGCRKDWQNLAPGCGIKTYMDAGVLQTLDVQTDVATTLKNGGLDLNSIEGIIWSHHHWDHTGDPSTFPTSTKLVVGPGFKAAFMPGYPADPDAQTLESDFAEREVQEIDFKTNVQQIGRFKAMDYFGDGSFYILDSPGHSIGHLNVLARTYASPHDGFIHLCGDSFHHAGEIRPSRYVPMPDNLVSSLPSGPEICACPASMFASLLRGGSKCEHILEFLDPGAGHYSEQKFALIYDTPSLRDTVRKVEECDANQTVFTLCAHDWTVKGSIDEWPESLDAWREKGLKDKVFWKFLEDFKKNV